jgi:hypothetical protein
LIEIGITNIGRAAIRCAAPGPNKFVRNLLTGNACATFLASKEGPQSAYSVEKLRGKILLEDAKALESL